jgi:hypothetical protein
MKGGEMDWIVLFESKIPMIALWIMGLLAFVTLVYFGRFRSRR